MADSSSPISPTSQALLSLLSTPSLDPCNHGSGEEVQDGLCSIVANPRGNINEELEEQPKVGIGMDETSFQVSSLSIPSPSCQSLGVQGDDVQTMESKGRESHVNADIHVSKLGSCEDGSLSPEISLFKDSIHGVSSHHGAASKSLEEPRVSEAKEGDKDERSQISHSGNTRATFLKAKPKFTTSGSCKSAECLLISRKVSNQLSKDSKVCYSMVYPRVALGASTSDQRVIERHLLQADVPKGGNREGEDSIVEGLEAHGKANEVSKLDGTFSISHAEDNLNEDVVHPRLEGKKN